MDERTRRLGLNEIVFREVNEKIEAVNAAFGALTGTMTVICECGDAACAEQIDLSPQEYARIRADPRWFVVVPGHEIEDIESVVEAHGPYYVIEKLPGGPGELAESADPRTP
jgi:hypothetical protein